jgi:hypothetical protein
VSGHWSERHGSVAGIISHSTQLTKTVAAATAQGHEKTAFLPKMQQAKVYSLSYESTQSGDDQAAMIQVITLARDQSNIWL